jgi:hypothetical protein
MMKRQQEFKKCCLKLFKFLEKEFNCKVEIEEDNLGVFITYLNKTTAIRVSYEHREDNVSILFSMLIDGKIPKYPIIIKPNTTIYSFYLDDILSFKSIPDEDKQRLGKKNIGIDFFERIQPLAKMVKEYTSDLILGDFRIFCQLEKMVKKRVDCTRSE